MASETSFDRPPHSAKGEAYSVDYDKLSQKATVYVHGARFDLTGPYENYAAALSAAQEFLRRRGVEL